MSYSAAVTSSLGKKLVSGMSGLVLVGFVIGHLIGNLLLLVGPRVFNEYAHFLENIFHGWGLIAAELALIAILLSHVWAGISVALRKSEARPRGYEKKADAGGPSHKGLASQSMIVTGVILLVFIVVHLINFKYAPADMYAVGQDHMRNLYGVVVTKFGDPLFSLGYIVVMVLLGMHLTHGVWSAFQSLGLTSRKYLPALTRVGGVLAVLLAVGFIFLPAIIWANNGYYLEQNAEYTRMMQQAGELMQGGGH